MDQLRIFCEDLCKPDHRMLFVYMIVDEFYLVNRYYSFSNLSKALRNVIRLLLQKHCRLIVNLVILFYYISYSFIFQRRLSFLIFSFTVSPSGSACFAMRIVSKT